MGRLPRSRVIVFVLAIIGLAALVGLWFLFHTLPWQSGVRQMLDDAELVEIFRFKDGKPTRWVRFDDPKQWSDLGPLLEFRATFWRFSDEPKDAIVIQTIKDRIRYGAWEVRGDGHLHLRKAARWYRMPVDPQFEIRVRQLLDEHGQDLPLDAPEAPGGPDNPSP